MIKEVVFNKVSTGLKLDELFYMDKYYLINKINNYIQVIEEYSKHVFAIGHTIQRV